jgi:hypothetical protein
MLWPTPVTSRSKAGPTSQDNMLPRTPMSCNRALK